MAEDDAATEENGVFAKSNGHGILRGDYGC